MLVRLILPIICFVIGAGVFAFGGMGEGGEVTCGGRVMTPADRCDEIRGGSTASYSYEEERDRQHGGRQNIRYAGGGIMALAVLAGIWVIATSGRSPVRKIGWEQLKPAAKTRAALAAARGWRLPDDGQNLLADARYGLLTEGVQRQARYPVVGELNGRSFAIFDFFRKPGGTGLKSDLIVLSTVWLVRTEPLPPFELRDQIGGKERGQFTEAGGGWFVRAPDLDSVRPLLTPQVMAILNDRKLTHVVADGRCLLTHRPEFDSGNRAQQLLITDLEATVAIADAIVQAAHQRV